jgi:hypothetical protein
MSKKISDYFKIKPKFSSNSEIRQVNSAAIAEIKNEKEGDFDIKLEKIEQKISKTSQNQQKVRECSVILQVINKNESLATIESVSSSNQKKMLKNHAKNNHKKSTQIECKLCDKKFKSSYILVHMNQVHSADMKKEQNVCKICNRKLLSKHGLVLHIKKMHEKAFFGKFEHYECDYDGEIFKEKAILQGHMNKHKLRVQCDICSAEIQPKYLKQHIREVHADFRKFQCQLCQKSFKSGPTLQNHIQIHNKAVKCSMCPKLFPGKGKLNQHLKLIHENPGSFECETCSKKFNKKGNLQIHQKIHDKNRSKPFKCQRCDYTTDVRISFKLHQNSHEYQDKKFAAIKDPIKCERCLKFYKNKHALKKHMHVVHPEVPYQCDLCGMYVKAKNSLKYHLLLHLRKQTILKASC